MQYVIVICVTISSPVWSYPIINTYLSLLLFNNLHSSHLEMQSTLQSVRKWDKKKDVLARKLMAWVCLAWIFSAQTYLLVLLSQYTVECFQGELHSSHSLECYTKADVGVSWHNTTCK